MDDIFFTFAVLNSERSSEDRLLQPENMNNIFVTFAVLNDSERVSEERFLQLEYLLLVDYQYYTL